MNEELTYHVPVLLKPSVDGMNIRPDGTYVDVTFGGGGHSREILSRLGDGGRLLGFDQDEDAEQNIVDNPHFIFVRSNFRYLHNFLRYHDIEEVDAIIKRLSTIFCSASSSWSNPSNRPPSPNRDSISRECPPPPKVTSTYVPSGRIFIPSTLGFNNTGT